MTTDIGNYLREIRGKRSLRNISELTGISHTHLSDIEKGKDRRTGKTMIPSPDALKKIADGTGADYLEMLKIAGYLSDYMEEKLIQLEQKAKKRSKENAKIADDFNFNEYDDVTNRLSIAIEQKKKITADNELIDKEDENKNAVFLLNLYRTLERSRLKAAHFDKETQSKLLNIIALLLSNARDIDIEDIHKQITESKPKNKKE